MDVLKPIEVSNSSSVQVGDQVIAIGNAFGLGKTFTSGIISATGRDYGNPYLELIQTDAAINPGNSGGALINHKGNLIGMNTKIFSQTGSYAGIGFALPANKMIEVASEIIQYGSVKRSWIGDFRVKIKRFLLNNKPAYGLEILELRNYGPLFNSGKIQPGAIILSINNQTPTWENLTGALKNSFPGDEISFQILQNSNVKDYQSYYRSYSHKIDQSSFQIGSRFSKNEVMPSFASSAREFSVITSEVNSYAADSTHFMLSIKSFFTNFHNRNRLSCNFLCKR